MEISVKEYGALGDGKHNDTEFIQSAIDECANNGGGRVLFKDGIFVSGTIYLRSHVYLEISEGALLLASPNIEDYKEDVHYNRYRNETELDRCFIFAKDETDIGIYGFGEINGNAQNFPNTESIYRPMLIRFLRCKNIHIKDVKLYNSAAWTTAFLDSLYIWINGLDIKNQYNYNGDSLDFDGCSHVYISDCNMEGTDDNLCLQSSSKKYPVSDIHVVNCSFSSICAAIRIGLKSIGNISNVSISNCTMSNVWREGIKIECSEGGTVSDISINNIQMRNVTRPVFILLNNRFEPDGLGSSIELEQMPEIGKIERINITNIYAADNEEMKDVHYRFGKDIMGEPKFSGIRVDANEKYPIKDLTMTNIHYRFIGGVSIEDIPKCYPKVIDKLATQKEIGSENYYPNWSRAVYLDIRNTKNLILDGIYLESILSDERPPVIIEECEVLKRDILLKDNG